MNMEAYFISHTPPPKEKVDFIASVDVIRIP